MSKIKTPEEKIEIAKRLLSGILSNLKGLDSAKVSNERYLAIYESVAAQFQQPALPAEGTVYLVKSVEEKPKEEGKKYFVGDMDGTLDVMKFEEGQFDYIQPDFYLDGPYSMSQVMQEFAEGFAEWVGKGWRFFSPTKQWTEANSMGKTFQASKTTAELLAEYTLYLQSKQP